MSDREGYDFEQIKSIAKVQVGCHAIDWVHGQLTRNCVQFATLLHVAGFDLPSRED